MLTRDQNRRFRPLVQQAWQEYCRQHPATHPANKTAHDIWYREQLVRAAGVRSTKDLEYWDAEAFGLLCLHFATLAGDDRQIDIFVHSSERVMLWCMRQIIARVGVNEGYATGIAKRMKFLAGEQRCLDDLPARHIWAVCICLNNKGKKDLGLDVWKEIIREYRQWTTDQWRAVVLGSHINADKPEYSDADDRPVAYANVADDEPTGPLTIEDDLPF